MLRAKCDDTIYDSEQLRHVMTRHESMVSISILIGLCLFLILLIRLANERIKKFFMKKIATLDVKEINEYLNIKRKNVVKALSICKNHKL
jgi:hypothetical protein